MTNTASSSTSANTVIAFGEALIDFTAKDGAYHPYTGGAPANVAVAVSKLGGESAFIGAVGDDFFGDMIIQDLQANGTQTDYTLKLDGYPTAAAYVSIDEAGERSFAFSRRDTADMNFPIDSIPLDVFQSRQGIMHVGSNSLTTDYQTAVTMAVVGVAKAHGWSISFDVNLRANLWADGQINHARIKQFIALADYIKLSDEELAALAPEVAAVEAMPTDSTGVFAALQAKQSAIIVLTSGPGSIKLYSHNTSIDYQPAKVKAVDTTGAGDAFFGGFVYYIAAHNVFSPNPADYEAAIQFASQCGAYSVQHYGAISSYPSLADLA